MSRRRVNYHRVVLPSMYSLRYAKGLGGSGSDCGDFTQCFIGSALRRPVEFARSTADVTHARVVQVLNREWQCANQRTDRLQNDAA